MEIMEASQAVAYAVKQCKPQVIPMYPITPQTHIVERLADFINDGKLKSSMVHVESEFSAISAAIGVSAAGSRVFTATASQGLALMHEVLHIVSGMRLPVVMAVANRALSAPINIWNDHQDSVSARDTGWIQLYVESAQEAYDTIFQAYRIAEQSLLPVMVCLDGFTLSHVYEPVAFITQKDTDNYVHRFKPNYPTLDPKKPMTFGPVGFPDSYIYFRHDEQKALLNSTKLIKSANTDFNKLTKRKYGDGLIETFNLKGATSAVVCMGSICGTARVALEGTKTALIKVKSYRPFPKAQFIKALTGIKNIAIIDKDISMGYEGALATDLKAALHNENKNIHGYIMGLGGQDITVEDFKDIITNITKPAKDAQFIMK